jgi:hypothetical protein
MTREETACWDNLAFQRVFLTERDASIWCQRHMKLGTPAQPFHYEPFAARCRAQAVSCIQEEADFLTAAKLMAHAALAQGDRTAAVELGRCTSC